jgi:hypothetical protein
LQLRLACSGVVTAFDPVAVNGWQLWQAIWQQQSSPRPVQTRPEEQPIETPHLERPKEIQKILLLVLL